MSFWGSPESRSRNFVDFSQIPCNGWLCEPIRQSMIFSRPQMTFRLMFLETAEIKQTWNQKTNAQWNHTSVDGWFLPASESHIYEQMISPCLSSSQQEIQFSSVAQSCLTLRDPINHSTPGLPVYYQLPDSTQTHVHWVSDAIQPSHPLSSPSPPALNLSQHQGLFKWISSSHQVANVLEFQLQHQSFQWTPRTDLL